MEANQTRGILCMLGAMAFISVQEAFAKYLGEMLPIPQVVWARYIGHLSLMLIVLWPRYGNSIFRANRLSMQILRSLILLLDTALFFYGLTMIGLAEATAIFFTVPALVVMLSIPLLGERVKLSAIIAIAVGFIGTLVIVRPGMELSTQQLEVQSGSDNLALGALFIFGAACCTAIYNVITRKLANTDPLPVTLFYTAMIGAVVSTLLVPFFWQTPTGLLPWLALISIGVFGGVAHSLIIAAHQYTEATVVAPFMYTQIFWALLLGWLIFEQLPDQYAFMGGALVMCSGLFLLLSQKKRKSY
ncbi:MAG: DMT family transporter [Oceanospirillaceae bacterium]